MAQTTNRATAANLWRVIYAVAIAAAIAEPGYSDAVQLSGARHVRWSSKEPVESIVRPGDTLVTVDRSPHREIFAEESTAEAELKVRAEHADDVFVAEITSVVPTLTENDSWATTTITANVKQIIKRNPDYPKTRTGLRKIFHDGAEVVVRGATVRIGSYPIVRRGKRYLMFTSYNPKDGTTHAGPAFEISRSGQLIKSESSLSGALPSVLNGIKVSDVVQWLKE